MPKRRNEACPGNDPARTLLHGDETRNPNALCSPNDRKLGDETTLYPRSCYASTGSRTLRTEILYGSGTAADDLPSSLVSPCYAGASAVHRYGSAGCSTTVSRNNHEDGAGNGRHKDSISSHQDGAERNDPAHPVSYVPHRE